MKAHIKVFLQICTLALILAAVLGLGLIQSASAKPASALGAWSQQWAAEFNGSSAGTRSNWIYDPGHRSCCGSRRNRGTGEIGHMTKHNATPHQHSRHPSLPPPPAP